MHRWSKLFIPTLREAPADAEVASHKFLVRSGYIRQLGAGIYSYLFLGQRSINRIIGIVREEMDRIGQEFLLPTIQPADLWRESGRWTIMGDNMFRLKDRKGASPATSSAATSSSRKSGTRFRQNSVTSLAPRPASSACASSS
jgi:prolyl-tRNA synthetase